MNDDNQKILEECNSEIEKISNWIDNHKLDTNVKFLVAYSVIKATGSIEIVFKSMIYQFLSENCIEETKMFLEKNIIDSSSNPSPGMMEKYLEVFDPERKKIFLNHLKNSQDKINLKNLVSLRNNIAHGRTINSSIHDVQNYFLSGKNVLLKLEEVLSNKS